MTGSQVDPPRTEKPMRFQYFWVVNADTMTGIEEMSRRALDGWRVIGVVADSMHSPKVLMERSVPK